MHAFSTRWSPTSGWSEPTAQVPAHTVQLVLAFGPVAAPPDAWFADVVTRWPHARVVYATAGGQIDGLDVVDQEVVITGLAFEHGHVHVLARNGAGVVPDAELGAALGADVAALSDVRHALLFVDGLYVNGAAFAAGFGGALPAGVTVSGGLASDGLNFVKTGVGVDGPPVERSVVAVALCGESIVVGTGSAGGWEPFGPERVVSRASGTTVYELDDERALDVYRRYLGDLAQELPGSALLFPIAVTSASGGATVVRTILGIDEAEGSLRFAGDVPQGDRVRLMRSTNDSILDGAALAANAAIAMLGGVVPQAMVCVSCVGRRAVLRSRIEEEIEEVTQLTPNAVITGYYSNGEIAPPLETPGSLALLHNQTMTITAIGER